MLILHFLCEKSQMLVSIVSWIFAPSCCREWDVWGDPTPPPHQESSPVWLESGGPPVPSPLPPAEVAEWKEPWWRSPSFRRKADEADEGWLSGTSDALNTSPTWCPAVCGHRFEEGQLVWGPASSSWCWSSEHLASTRTRSCTTTKACWLKGSEGLL